MFRNWSITWRLSVSVMAVTAVILAAVIGYGYVVARQILEQELEGKAWQLSLATVNRIQTVETAVRKLAGSLSLAVSLPTMLVAFARYSQDASFRILHANKAFVVTMAAGSILGTLLGAALLTVAPSSAIIPALVLILRA